MAKVGCNHYWFYEHTVYGSDGGGTTVVRQCSNCNEVQVGEVTRWREPRENEFDPLPRPAETPAKD